MVAVRQAPLAMPDADKERVAEAWRRRMLLDSTWRDLLAEHGERQLGPLRARLVGEWDTSANLFASVVDQTSTMYDDEPVQKSSDDGSLRVIRESFEHGGWWAMARQHQKYVRGLQESLVYVGWDADEEHPTFELATPDVVSIECAPTNKASPVTIWFARRRPVPGSPTGEEAWYWDRWSVAGGVGSLTIWTNDRRREVTEQFIVPAEWSGDAYPWKNEANKPILPFVVYHALGAGTGMWCPHQRSEVVFGTLQVGLLWTAAVHGMLRASWDQRVLLNGKIRGGTTETAAGKVARFVTPDPTMILQADGDGASIDAWGASIDIDKAERFCRMYEARLAVHFGLSPSDLVIESLNPASGASITVSQAGKRKIANRDAVCMRIGDRQLVELVCAVNRAKGRPCSAKGYRLRYHGVALTISEREAVGRVVKGELELGLLDRPTAYMELHPGTTLDDAEADLAELDARVSAEKELDAVKGELSPPEPGQPATSETPVADTAMNGAQVIAAQSIVQAVADGLLPRDSGVAMLEEFFQLDAANAERVMGSVGKEFVPKAKIVPPPFGGAPPPVDPAPDADPVAET